MDSIDSTPANYGSNEPKRMPSFLNTLTVLSLVGSGLAAISGVYNYFTSCSSIEKMEELDLEALGSGAMADMMEAAKELMVKQCENKLALLLAVLISSALCAWGAYQMRSLKRQGFVLYTLGELLYPVATLVILGTGAAGSAMMMAGFIIPVIMVILYFTQLKHLNQ